MTESTLQVFELKTSEHFKKYNGYLNLIGINNPFFKIELLLNEYTQNEQLRYFVFVTNEVPKIVMPFHSREITINNQSSGYRDVVSPYGYSGPLISKLATEKEIIEFWNCVDTWYRNNNIISEFIRFSLNNNQIFYNGHIVPTLKNVKGEILSKDRQWENFDKKVRNNFRKAVQNNLTFKICHQNIEEDDLDAFYKIYISTMIRKNAEKILFYSLEYFKTYAENNPKNCALAIVYYEKMPISTEFLLLSDNTLYSFLGGTLSEHFKTRPNDFLKVNVLDWGRENQFKYYVLGGGREDNDYLYAYKKSFFPKDTDEIFYTGRKIINTTVYDQLVRDKMLESECGEDIIVENKSDFFPAYRNEHTAS